MDTWFYSPPFSGKGAKPLRIAKSSRKIKYPLFFYGSGYPEGRQGAESPSSNPAPPLQNRLFSLEKRGFVDDSGDSLARLTEMFLGAKAAHKTTISTGAAPAGMDRYK